MQLQGAVINFLGDSITQGVGASCVEKRYPEVLAAMFGLKKANNYGISGSRIARQSVLSALPLDRDFCMRMAEMDESADAVVVFGGTNDFGHGDAPLGGMADRTPYTFYGACHTLMNGLLEGYAGKPVAILTPLHRRNEQDTVMHRTDGVPVEKPGGLRAYRDALVEVAAYYALPVLDLYAVSQMQPENAVCAARLLPDRLHPSDAGHALLARKIGLFLQQL